MQYNQLCCASYPNCVHVYAAYSCNTGPQWLPNPCMPTPFCEPPRPCPEVIGEGEVTTVVLPDGTTQLYFLPLTKWCKPQIFNLPCGNAFQNANYGIWFIRSFTNTQTLPFPYCSNTTCFPTSRGPVCCTLPYPALCDRAFHNDAWTSTTDLRYFCPGIRCTVCNVFPSKCCSVQTSLLCCDRRVENKPSRMSIDECEQRNEKCRRKKKPCSRDSDESINSTCTCTSHDEACSEYDSGKKTKRNKKRPKPTKNEKTSETCCCSRTVNSKKKKESGTTKPSDCEDDLCSSCRQAQRRQYDDLCLTCRRELGDSNKNWNLQSNEPFASDYWDPTRGGGRTAQKDTINTTPSQCSNSTIESMYDFKAESWVPRADRGEDPR